MWLLPHGFDFLTRFRRANHWLALMHLWLLARCGNLRRRANYWLWRTIHLRCMVRLGLRARRGRLCRSAAVVSVQAAPVGVEVGAKRANGQQRD